MCPNNQNQTNEAHGKLYIQGCIESLSGQLHISYTEKKKIYLTQIIDYSELLSNKY